MNPTEPNKSGLTERQIKALPFFASCTTYEEACRRAEINRTTFYEWLKDPLFKSELNRLRDSIIEEATGILKTSATEAVSKLLYLMRNSSNENIQRAAANDVLEHLTEYRKCEDIMEKIVDLESRIKKQKSIQQIK